MVSFLYDLARIYLQDREKALAAAAMLSVLPVFFMSDGPAHSGYADTPLAMLFFLAFGLTLLWRKNRDLGFLLLSAFLTAILVFTKNEGANLIALNAFLMILPTKTGINRKAIFDIMKNLIIYLGIIMLIVAPWYLLISRLPSGESVADISKVSVSNIYKNITMVPIIFKFTFMAFIGIQQNMMNQGYLWALLWIIFVITTIMSVFARYTDCAYFSLIVLLYILAITLTYIILPWEIPKEGGNVSNFFRLYLAVNPIVIMQIVSTLKALGDSKRSA